MADEQELLRDKIADLIEAIDILSEQPCLECADKILAKLKALGWGKQRSLVPPEILEATIQERIRQYLEDNELVKWDREKVAEAINKIPRDGYDYGRDVADQLHQELTGVNDDNNR